MEVVDKIRESVSAISDLTEMGLLDQAEQLCRNSVGEWGRHTDLVRLQELIDAKQLAKERRADNGSKYCPVCGESFKDFLPLPEYYVQNMLRHRFKHIGRGEMTSIDEYSCPSCGASDRERLYGAWIKHESTSRRITGVEKLVHFAPEPALSKMIRSMNIFGEYNTADMNMPGVDCHVDITALPFEDGSFDFFICSHVLEHIVHDRRALSEIFRITRQDGRGILMVPISLGIERSVEGTGNESPEEQWRLFGQNDHVRLYAHDDFVSKIIETGFHLTELGVNYFGKKVYESLGLRDTSILYVVEKW